MIDARTAPSRADRRTTPARRRTNASRLVRTAVSATTVLALAVLPQTPLTASPASAATEPTVRCPIAKAPPNPHTPHPKPPVPPARPEPAHPVGGDRLGGTGLVLPTGAPPLPAGISSTSWVVADLDSGTVIGACAPHVRHPPASTQKLLTLLTSLPKVHPDETITATKGDTDIEAGSSSLGMVTGGKYQVNMLLTGMVLVSGNDAAQTVARLAGGSGGVPATVSAMNETAKHLQALDTTAGNPHGLDAPNQFSSAYDLALIARADFARPDFRKLAATRTAQIPAQRVTENGKPKNLPGYQIQNDNKLLSRYPGALGGKTGFTDVARHTYVGVAQRNGRRLVVTLMNGEQQPVKMWEQGSRLLTWGFGQPAGKGVGTLAQPAADAPAKASGGPAKAHEAAGSSQEDGLGGTKLLAISAGVAVGLIAVIGALIFLFRAQRPSRGHGHGNRRR